MALKLHYDFKNYPQLDGHAAYNSVPGTPDLSITRATTGKMKDADGLLREVQSGEARFQGASFSHNLILQSSDFDTTWTNSNSTETSGKTDPFGGTDAWGLNEDGTAATGHYLVQSVTTNSGHHYIFSVYAKASNRSWMMLHMNTASYSANIQAWFDLSTGAVGQVNAVATSGIEDIGNGWYRCWVACDADATASNQYRIYAANADASVTFDGLTQESILIYGAQLEDVSGAWDSENLFPESEDLGNAAWLDIGSVTVTANAGTDPDGGNTAASLSVGAGAWYWYDNIAGSRNSRIVSVWAKRNTTSDQTFRLFNGGQDSGDFTATDTWQRFSWKSVSGVSANVGIRGDSSNSAAELLIWHPQLETAKPSQTAAGTYTGTSGSTVVNYSPSTYIATTTAAVSSLSGSNDGLLVEEARTNICLQSEDFSTTWTSGGSASTVSTDQTIAPDGALTADLVVDDGITAGPTAVALSQSVTVTAGSNTFSLFAKADQLSWVDLRSLGFDAGGDGETYFDLSTGAVGTTSANHTAGIEDYGNGWYRCYITFSTTTDLVGSVLIYVADADGDRSVDIDGTSSIFVWGAQLEAGSFPTSYIPTTTGSVTRNIDLVYTDDMSWWSAGAACSFYASAARERAENPIGSANQYILSAGQVGTYTNEFWLYSNTSGAPICYLENSGSAVVNIAAGNLFQSTTASVKMSMAFDANDAAYYASGSQIGTDSSLSVPSVWTRLAIGMRATSAASWNGLIKEIAYWPERLENATLSDLSDGSIAPGAVQTGGLILPRQRMIKRRAKARRKGLVRYRRGRRMDF